MIPRTTIEEANKHITGLHKKVYELESLVKEQHGALLAKDAFLQTKLTEVSSAKELDIGLLQEKLESKERTVTILQEQMSQKNQQIAALQRNFRAFRKMISFKTDLREFLVLMNEAETCLKSSMEWIDEEFFDDDEKSFEGDSGMGTSIQFLNRSTNLLEDVNPAYNSSQSAGNSGKHFPQNSKEREFYL